MTIFWIYVVTQLVTTAYGITVINSVKKVPALKKRLAHAGYTKQEKDSLYKFNDFLKHFLLGFIPFYFAIKAVQLINDDDPVGVLMKDEIKNGNYISDEDRALFEEEQRRADASIAYDPNLKLYEEVEPYHARKIELNNIYNDDETPTEYIEKEISNENIKLTPFTSETNPYENKVYTSNNIVSIDDDKKENTYEYSPSTIKIDNPIIDDSKPKEEWIEDRAAILYDELLEEKERTNDTSNNNIDLWLKANRQAEEEYENNHKPKKEIIIEKPKEDVKETIINKEITNSDIAAAISKLSEEELKELSNKLITLAEIKKNKDLLLEKDVA